MPNAIGQRGKGAEEAVMEVLKKLSIRPAFDFERNYDARSAQGHSYARRCGDFTWYANAGGETQHGVIEVKETSNPTSLPYSNMETHQAGKLERRSMAGGHSLVLVYHTSVKLWRPVDSHIFLSREGRGSWKFDSWPAYATLAEIPLFRGLSELLKVTL